MCSRFQMGSNSPLANRKARMFWAASFPRKWSIRKTCSSSKTSWTTAFRRWRREQVGAERLLHDDPGTVGQPRPRRACAPRRRRHGAGCSGSAGDGARRRASASACSTALARPADPADPGDVADAFAEPVPVVVGDLAPGELVAGGSGPGAGTRTSSSSSSEVATIRHSGQQSGSGEMEEAGQELAAGQVAGGPEEDDHVRGDRRVVVVGRRRRWPLDGRDPTVDPDPGPTGESARGASRRFALVVRTLPSVGSMLSPAQVRPTGVRPSAAGLEPTRPGTHRSDQTVDPGIAGPHPSLTGSSYGQFVSTRLRL